MTKRITTLLIIAAIIFGACDRHQDQQGNEPANGTADIEWSPAGTCFPILEHDRFMFLCWYELIDIGADVLLDEFQDPSAEWRLRKLKDAGFDIYFATTAMAIEAMSAHPSLYAYNVWDEPDLIEYPEVLRRLKEIYSHDKTRPCYVNLYPNYGIDEWTEENYLNTLRHYLQSLPVSFLSFDYYPVIMKEGCMVP